MGIKGLAGQQREQMVGFVSKPLAVWLRTMAIKSFPIPQSAEACDIMAEAIGVAVMQTIGASPMGRSALRRYALDILDETKG